ncbi:UNVERIFIED_CONTAM: hypothetical protein HDU68_009398 [Siphonaria sp. JEL0065]|nr:hypothetical protein HDU68_009398 [Siphonaria sp. JEL0065]
MDMDFYTPSLSELTTLSSFSVEAQSTEAAKAAKAAKAKSKRSHSANDKDKDFGKDFEKDELDKPKRGRKLAPLPVEPENKRLAQNRIAQRAFRERKVNHVKDLETKVAELTQIIQGSKQLAPLLEVADLKQKVQELEDRNAALVAENNQLRQMTFSFDPKLQTQLSPVESVDPISNSLFLNSTLPQQDFASLMAPAPSIPQTNNGFSTIQSINTANTINGINTMRTDLTAAPSVLDFMSLLNYDTFRNTPPAPGLDAFLFDDMELESLLMTPASSFVPSAAPVSAPTLASTTNITTTINATKTATLPTTLMPLENLKNCMAHKAQLSPDSMTLQFGCVSKALSSVPPLQQNCELVDELCNLFVDFTTECDAREERLSCPKELVEMKEKVLMVAGDGFKEYVGAVFEEVTVQFRDYATRRGFDVLNGDEFFE